MAEKEYIEREAAEEELLYAMVGTGYQSRAIDAINFMPAADVVEVVHGVWKKRKNWRLYVCSACSHENDEPYRYCPNCGAKMDGKGDKR